MSSSFSSRRKAHRHALRAALAVTGRARRPMLNLCCVMLPALAACTELPDQSSAAENSWGLADERADMRGVRDMTSAISRDQGMTGNVLDMMTVIDLPDQSPMPDSGPAPMVDMYLEDASSFEDASPDMFVADAGSGTDMQPVANCVDDRGQTDWRCCETHALEATGCELCEERFPLDDEPRACLNCAFDGECCVAIEPLIDPPADQFDPLGCAPWGPPAPPEYTGFRLPRRLVA